VESGTAGVVPGVEPEPEPAPVPEPTAADCEDLVEPEPEAEAEAEAEAEPEPEPEANKIDQSKGSTKKEAQGSSKSKLEPEPEPHSKLEPLSVEGVTVDKKNHKELSGKPLTFTVNEQGVLIEAGGSSAEVSWDWDQLQDAVAKKAVLTVTVAVDKKNKKYVFTMPSKEQAVEVATAIKERDSVAAGDYDDLVEPEPEAGAELEAEVVPAAEVEAEPEQVTDAEAEVESEPQPTPA